MFLLSPAAPRVVFIGDGNGELPGGGSWLSSLPEICLGNFIKVPRFLVLLSLPSRKVGGLEHFCPRWVPEVFVCVAGVCVRRRLVGVRRVRTSLADERHTGWARRPPDNEYLARVAVGLAVPCVLGDVVHFPARVHLTSSGGPFRF